MNVPVSESDGFMVAIRRARRAVVVAERRGEGAGMPKLLEELDNLARPGTSSRSQNAVWIDAVHASLLVRTTTDLHRRSRSRLIAELRATCQEEDFLDDPWGALDGTVCVARMERIRALRRLAAKRATLACNHYVRTRRTRFLRDSVRILQTACDAETRITGSRLTDSNCDAEMERLGAALRSSMPPWAWTFFAAILQGDVRSSLTATRIRLTPAMAYRLEVWSRQGSWDMPAPGDDPVCRGRWFGQPLDSVFKRFLQDERQMREAEAAKRAEEQRRFEEWQARASERMDAKSHVGSQDADNVVPAVKKGAAQARVGGKASREHAAGYELVQLADGPQVIASAMAAAVRQELAWRKRRDQMEAEREEERKLYYERIGKRYEPKPRRYFW